MERSELLSKLNGLLAEIDERASGEALEELAAELEDAIFLLECAEGEEEAAGALEEIAGLAEELRDLAEGDLRLTAAAHRLRRMAEE